MSLAGVQLSNILPFNDRQAFFQQRGQDIRQLGRALNSGDLAGAQQAYSSLLALARQNGAPDGASGNVPAGLFRNPKVASDFAALGQALQAGDLAAAQQAFASFRQDLRSGRHQNGAQQPANSTIPEIIINLSGILPDNSGASQSSPPATAPTSSTNTDTSASDSSPSSSTTTPAATSTSTLPEIVLNLFGGNGAFAGPEIVFNFGSSGTNGSGSAPAQSSSGTGDTQSSQNPEIVFNLANSGVSEIDLNLGGSNPGLVLKFASQPTSSSNLNVVA